MGRDGDSGDGLVDDGSWASGSMIPSVRYTVLRGQLQCSDVDLLLELNSWLFVHILGKVKEAKGDIWVGKWGETETGDLLGKMGEVGDFSGKSIFFQSMRCMHKCRK